MRHPVPYFGGKMRIAKEIVRLMPAHGHYVEPYAGSLSVLLAKPPARHETINDLDGALVTFWRVLRDQPDELHRVCALTPHSRAEHKSCRDMVVPGDELETARRVWVRLTQGRAGIPASGWRHYQAPGGSSASMPDYLHGYADRIPPAARRLAAVTLECRSALDVIADYGRHDGVLLYVDPPYLGSTRNSGGYAVEMTGDDEHAALLDALLAARAGVVLSGYPSQLYDDALTGWDRVEIPTATGQGGVWQDRTEIVWSNRHIAAPNLLDLVPGGAA